MTICRAKSSLPPRLKWRRSDEARMNPLSIRIGGAERRPEVLLREAEPKSRSRGSGVDITRDITRKAVV